MNNDAGTQPDVQIGDNRLEINRVFHYPRQTVFEAWTKPEIVDQWWGCNDTERVNSTIDFREGGEFSHVMHMKNDTSFTYSGRYLELVIPERIVTECNIDPTNADAKAKVTVEFLEQGNSTRVRLVQVGFPPFPDIEKIVGSGFTAALNKLDRVLAA